MQKSKTIKEIVKKKLTNSKYDICMFCAFQTLFWEGIHRLQQKWKVCSPVDIINSDKEIHTHKKIELKRWSVKGKSMSYRHSFFDKSKF